MMHADFETENIQLLTSRWERLRAGALPSSVGFSQATAASLLALNQGQVVRAATVHRPLFTLIPSEEVLENALNTDQARGVQDQDVLLFLINRWRAAAGSFTFAEMYFCMSKSVYSLLKAATFPKIQAAASVGVDLMTIGVRPQYFTHAGQRFDMETAHRTKLAICNSTNTGY